MKHEYGLAFLRVRGIERVRLHADLTMLGRLSLALARARGRSARGLDVQQRFVVPNILVTGSQLEAPARGQG